MPCGERLQSCTSSTLEAGLWGLLQIRLDRINLLRFPNVIDEIGVFMMTNRKPRHN